MKKAQYLLLAISVFGLFAAQAQIQVSSQTICQGQAVHLSTSANQITSYFMYSFDSLNMGNLSTTASNPVFNNPCGDGPNGPHVWISTTASTFRTIETPVLNADPNIDMTVEFWMRYGRQPNAGNCEDPDAQDEGVHLQYKTASMSGWVDFPGSTLPLGTNLTQGPYTNATTTPGSGGYWTPVSSLSAQQSSPLYHWHRYKCVLPDTAISAGLQIRWAQLITSSTGYDAWGIDEISINSNFIAQNFEWRDAYGNVLGNTTNLTYTFVQSQWVYLETFGTGGISFMDSVYITVLPKPYINLGGSDTICKNAHKVLDAGYGFTDYIWSTGDSSQTLVAMYPNLSLGSNTISVCVTASNGCSACDTIVLFIDDCTGLSDISHKLNCKVFPNPSSGMLTVEAEGLENGAYTLQWISATGALVKEVHTDVSGKYLNEQVDLSALSSGIYQLNLLGPDQVYAIGKVILK